MTNNVIPFPDYRRMNPRRVIRESETPAPVVYDFTPTYVAADKRRRFHEIMNQVDIFGSSEIARIETRKDVYTLLLYAMTEKLKRLRYPLNMHALDALIFIARTVSKRLIKKSPKSFRTPEYVFHESGEKRQDEEVIAAYVFSPTDVEKDELEWLKTAAKNLYLSMLTVNAEKDWAAIEDEEKMYEYLASVFPLVIDTVKDYMMPFREHPHSGIDHSANS